MCGICGCNNSDTQIERERMLCSGCGSTWRVRAVAQALLRGLKIPPASIANIPQEWSRVGLGISDNPVLSSALSSRFDYTNSYYHKFPKLDITHLPIDLHEQFEFVICSDVLEHVPPPAESGIIGINRLLKAGGVAVVSVPVGALDDTDEYYPNLLKWMEHDGVVEWSDTSGAHHVDREPEYHGGEGQTLAFRLWNASALVKSFLNNGFREYDVIPDLASLGVPYLDYNGLFIFRK